MSAAPQPLPGSSRLRLDVHLDAAELAQSLVTDVRAGLSRRPRALPPKWFYDERGSALFEAITELPEYYLTRAERAILARQAGEIAELTGADTLVELGSGTSSKTRLLLDALSRRGTLRRLVPLDVSESTLVAASAAIAERYAGIQVHGVVGDFERHLSFLPGGGRRLVAFLGSTIGNLVPEQRAKLLCQLAAALGGGDALLLGTDLVKDPARMVAAYDDAAGVTAEFNRNLLVVLNRHLAGDFEPAAFAHVARWDAGQEWMAMGLRAGEAQTVHLEALGIDVRFEAGEELGTEISAKFSPAGLAAECRAAGLEPAGWWTDPDGDFALSLWRPA